MKIKHTSILIFFLALQSSFAQVEDISLTFSPAAEYTFWDDKAGLKDGALIGGKVGFGFGKYVELRATYMQGLGLTTNFEDYGFLSYTDGIIPERDVDLTRWGGEFKANFGAKTKLNPYFTLGTGVQTVNLDGFEKNKQVFATIGLGAKFNIGKRVVFALEAKNTMFNFNSGARLLTNDDRAALGVSQNDMETERLSNWSAMASLQFYLSGRRPEELTELDSAYLKTFSNGFKGLRFALEPSLAHIGFDKDSRYRDAWFAGGYLGLDFDDYVGLRAFYFKASENDKISTDFDHLQMYGGEFRARLNVARGVVPYLAIGGGYLDTSDDYAGADGFEADDSFFASGGLGLNIPLTREVVAFGGVRALLTSDTNEENLQDPDRINTHTMYNFGIKFNIGSRSKSPREVYERNIRENVDEALLIQDKENKRKLEELNAGYQAQIAELEEEQEKANKEKDVERAVRIIEEKNEVKKALREVEDVERIDSEKRARDTSVSSMPDEEIVQLTPVEFELLITRILDEVQGPVSDDPEYTGNGEILENHTEVEVLKQRIEVLEKLLLQLNESTLEQSLNKQSSAPDRSPDDEQKEALSLKLLDKLDELNSHIEHNSDQINLLNSSTNGSESGKIIVDTGRGRNEGAAGFTDRGGMTTLQGEPYKPTFFQRLHYKNSSAMIGVMLGKDTFPLASYRAHFDIEDSRLEFMPELFLGATNPLSFGLSFNGVLPVKMQKASTIKPYLGAGLGYMKIYDDGKLNANLILGSYINVWEGKLYIDYTNRNFFKYNQVSVGYRLNF